jgi:dethiobiotin synthetase
MNYFITGIDTDAGKSIVTGVMALYLKSKGVNVITQKLAQTGCVNSSEDILTHRELMGMEMVSEDYEGLTCPYVFSFPASPHLAARLDGVTIDPQLLSAATDELGNRYHTVLIEGAGGLMVPLSDELNLIDYLVDRQYPIILVTSAKIGSINHTLLTLEVCKAKGLEVVGLVFNHFGSPNKVVAEDSLSLFRRTLPQYFPLAKVVEVPVIDARSEVVDFSEIFLGA